MSSLDPATYLRSLGTSHLCARAVSNSRTNKKHEKEVKGHALNRRMGDVTHLSGRSDPRRATAPRSISSLEIVQAAETEGHFMNTEVGLGAGEGDGPPSKKGKTCVVTFTVLQLPPWNRGKVYKGSSNGFFWAALRGQGGLSSAVVSARKMPS